MIECPDCHHNEMVGAFFCSQCGAQLLHLNGPASITITEPIETNEKPDQAKKLKVDQVFDEDLSSADALYTLILLNNEENIPINTSDEITLGRINEGQPILPDIDLSPYNAYELGVSRIHVSLKIIDNQVMATDLGSANGTRLNGQEISSHTQFSIQNGDYLTIGKLKIQIQIHKTNKNGG